MQRSTITIYNTKELQNVTISNVKVETLARHVTRLNSTDYTLTKSKYHVSPVPRTYRPCDIMYPDH